MGCWRKRKEVLGVEQKNEWISEEHGGQENRNMPSSRIKLPWGMLTSVLKEY